MKKNKTVLFVILLLFYGANFGNVYSSEVDGLVVPYTIGDEDTVRSEEELKKYIETSVKKKDKMYFKNREEVMFAQQFGYISKDTGQVLYKASCCAGM